MKAAGNNPDSAAMLLIADKLNELVELQAKAISNIKIDKVTVWDSGTNGDGKTSTSNFISGMYKSVPLLDEIFKLAGLNLPEYLKGKKDQDQEAEVQE